MLDPPAGASIIPSAACPWFQVAFSCDDGRGWEKEVQTLYTLVGQRETFLWPRIDGAGDVMTEMRNRLGTHYRYSVGDELDGFRSRK